MRTATTTQTIALDQLGSAAATTWRDLLADLGDRLPLWERAAEVRPTGSRSFGDANSTVDWPCCALLRELRTTTPMPKCCSAWRVQRRLVRSMREDRLGMSSTATRSFTPSLTARGASTRCAALHRPDVRMSWDDSTGVLAGDTYTECRPGRRDEPLERRGQEHGARRSPAGLEPHEGWEPICDSWGSTHRRTAAPRQRHAILQGGHHRGRSPSSTGWWDEREPPGPAGCTERPPQLLS